MQFRPLRAAALAVVLTACRGAEAPSSIDMVLPDGTSRRGELVVRSAFAEYAELGELRRELRITLATYPLSCDRYEPPADGELLFVVTLTAPASEPLKPGSFRSGPQPAADAGSTKVTQPNVLAVARRSDRAFVFPPGGVVELRQLELGPGGSVQGLIALEFAGDGTRPAASARGKFSARMCKPG